MQRRSERRLEEHVMKTGRHKDIAKEAVKAWSEDADAHFPGGASLAVIIASIRQHASRFVVAAVTFAPP